MEATTKSPAEMAIAFYGHMSEGRLDAAVAMLHEDLYVHESDELPYGGAYHGPDGFLELATRLDAVCATELLGIEAHGSGDTAAVHMKGRFTSRSSGQSVETEVVELVTFRDGRIVRMNIFYKDPNAIAALAP
jgi:ketosteroid isomerase-like protein